MPTALRGHVLVRQASSHGHAKPWPWHPTLIRDIDKALVEDAQRPPKAPRNRLQGGDQWEPGPPLAVGPGIRSRTIVVVTAVAYGGGFGEDRLPRQLDAVLVVDGDHLNRELVADLAHV
jgi:hypothetical protein